MAKVTSERYDVMTGMTTAESEAVDKDLRAAFEDAKIALSYALGRLPRKEHDPSRVMTTAEKLARSEAMMNQLDAAFGSPVTWTPPKPSPCTSASGVVVDKYESSRDKLARLVRESSKDPPEGCSREQFEREVINELGDRTVRNAGAFVLEVAVNLAALRVTERHDAKWAKFRGER